jgi:hypothetical protein
MPILGIMASAISGNLWSPGKDYDSIATVSLGATTASSISFTSIPSTYRHLQLRLFARAIQGNNSDGVIMRFNSDTGNNYTLHWLSGDGSSASALGIAPYGGIRLGQLSADNAPTGTLGANVVDVLDYANTNKYKTGRALGGYDANGFGQVMLTSGVWMNTAAVTSITMTVTGGTGFQQYTHAALYGVK